MPLTDAQKVNFEVTIRGTLAALGGSAQLTVTPLHYRRSSFGTAFSATEFITAFHTLIKTDLKAALSSSWNWDATTIRCLNSPTEMATVVAVGEPGTIIGDPAPGFVAFVMSKRTALRGRSYMGRTYLPGVPESSTTGNAITAAQGILLDTVATRMKTGITTAASLTYVPAVFSRKKSDLVLDPSTVTFTDITDVLKRTVLGRLVSRKSTVV